MLFLHNNFLSTHYMFFIELCIVGTAVVRLEGEGFQDSLIELKKWSWGDIKRPLERWYV